MTLALMISILSACQRHEHVLTVYIRPTQDSQRALAATKPLEEMLLEALKKEGLHYDRVHVRVGSSEHLIYESLKSGIADIGMLNFGEYLIDIAQDASFDTVVPLLISTRGAMNKNSPNPSDWNTLEQIIRDDRVQVHYQLGLMLAGPSPYGRMLADKINRNEPLTWDDWNQATVCVNSINRTSTIFIAHDLYRLYQRVVTDLDNYIVIDNAALRIASLAAGHCDVIQAPVITQARYADQWNDPNGFARPKSIYEETDVIYVSGRRLNDGILISKVNITNQAQTSIQNALLSIIQSEAGLDLFSMYSVGGFKVYEDGDFDDEIAVQQFMIAQGINSDD